MRMSRRNVFAFPAGRAPGFDSAHLAASKIKVCAVPIGTSWVNLLNGAVASKVGSSSPGSGILSGTGPYVSYRNGTDHYHTFSAPIGNSSAGCTYGAICQWDSFTGEQNICQNYDAGGGTTFETDSSGNIGFYCQGFTYSSIALSTGVPYFVAASRADRFFTGDPISVVVTNLNTGQIKTDTVSINAQPFSDDGTFYFGDNAGVQPLRGVQSAIMFARDYVPLSGLKQWALDPWSFWYPQSRVQRAAPLMFLHPDGDDAVGNWTRGS